jgi:hypothetical protein
MMDPLADASMIVLDTWYVLDRTFERDLPLGICDA